MNIEQIKVYCVASRRRDVDCHVYINASDTRASVAQAINRMRWRSPVEKDYHWAVEDVVGDAVLNTQEGDGLDELMAYLALVKHYGADLAAIAIVEGKGSIKTAAKILENCYLDKFKSAADFAETTLLYQSLDRASKYTGMCVDLEALGQHLLATDYRAFKSIGGGLYVFFQSEDMTSPLPNTHCVEDFID